jgi:uncharacterized protein YlxW (UPF0749 family)
MNIKILVGVAALITMYAGFSWNDEEPVIEDVPVRVIQTKTEQEHQQLQELAAQIRAAQTKINEVLAQVSTKR